MNTRMYENPVTQDNIRKLEEYGMTIAFPTSGHLACGDIGKGKMLEPEELFQYILMACAFEKDMAGKHVLVTAGATQEALHPVRWDIVLQRSVHSEVRRSCWSVDIRLLRHRFLLSGLA